jgi:hypothetical protein
LNAVNSSLIFKNCIAVDLYLHFTFSIFRHSTVCSPCYQLLIKLRQRQCGIAQVFDCSKFEFNYENDNNNGTSTYKTSASSYATGILQNCRKTTPSVKYIDMTVVSPTSNECERMFSRAKLALGDLRTSMIPKNLESLTFLHYNSDLWNAVTIQQILDEACHNKHDHTNNEINNYEDNDEEADDEDVDEEDFDEIQTAVISKNSSA